jgi:hypothetical protein
MKVLYSLLNWKRYDKEMAKSLDKIQKEDVLICTDDKTRWNQKLYKFIDAEESIPASKNKILKYALDNGYTHCFIIEDDVFIKDKIVFNIMMYGFQDPRNKVLNGRINPCMLISVKNQTPYCINRFPCSAMILYRVFEDMTFFDERLQALEHDFLIQDMVDQDNYQFQGFIFDVYNSWNKFRKIPLEGVKKVNQDAIIHDKQVRKESELSLSNNGDEIIQYMIEKLRG